jgi:hypothetical protein
MENFLYEGPNLPVLSLSEMRIGKNIQSSATHIFYFLLYSCMAEWYRESGNIENRIKEKG